MSISRRLDRRSPVRQLAGRVGVAILLVGIGGLVQGCSASRDYGDGSGSSKLWGSDSSASRTSAQASRDDGMQPSAFDKDGPGSGSQVTYRGGRDPITGRAQEWAPAGPAPVQSASLPPLQPATPSSSSARSIAPAGPRSVTATGAGSSSVEVKQGDTLYRIARSNNVTVQALMQANGLANESIKAGQHLSIPGR